MKPLSYMIVGRGTEKAMEGLESNVKKQLLYKFRTAYVKSASYLQSHMPIKNDLLRSFRCLHPLMRDRQQSVAELDMLVATFEHYLLKEELEGIKDEWSLYASETAIEDSWLSYTNDDNQVVWRSADVYWHRVSKLTRTSDNQPKYKGLAKLAKIALSMSQGNADVERGFSSNNLIVSDLRTGLDHDMIRSIRWIKDSLAFYDPESSRPERFPLSKSLLKACNMARAAYQVHLAGERCKRAEEKVRKDAYKESNHRGPCVIETKD